MCSGARSAADSIKQEVTQAIVVTSHLKAVGGNVCQLFHTGVHHLASSTPSNTAQSSQQAEAASWWPKGLSNKLGMQRDSRTAQNSSSVDGCPAAYTICEQLQLLIIPPHLAWMPAACKPRPPAAPLPLVRPAMFAQ